MAPWQCTWWPFQGAEVMVTLLEPEPRIREELEGLPMSYLVNVLSWLMVHLVPTELPSTHTPSTLVRSSRYTPPGQVPARLGTAPDSNPAFQVRYRETGGTSHACRIHSEWQMGLSPLAV